ncbi:DUF302 domain-containing protein [Roseomonas sp. HJA6]|uniref:DUF302 domain-containing protein n=1 Tax=Roseomonas alba TaxID=2846776 RepID=A0ABS7AD53_9PROT|nr:DUF302 domain-containing protein [Neoroseomonas alba]MBW6399662.1 DUF302 domain-containing protein [Neoroseomonas alba]
MPSPTLRRRIALAGGAVAAAAGPAAAQDSGLVTVPSPHPVRETIDRFSAAVRAEGWVVFTEIDHAAAARAVGMTLAPRTVVLFGNPRAGTPAMAATPLLAIDLPMRVLVWQDEAGRTQVTRSTGEDIATRLFARHGIAVPPDGRRATDTFIAGLVAQAVG